MAKLDGIYPLEYRNEDLKSINFSKNRFNLKNITTKLIYFRS